MAINREQLNSVHKGERRYETVELPNGDILRGRSLLRGEERRQRQFLRNKKGELDTTKIEYIDDVFAAYRLVDDNDELIVTPEEALNGYFDDWNDEHIACLVQLLRKLREKEPEDDRRDEIVTLMLDPDLTDDELLGLARKLSKVKNTEVEDAVKN